MGSRFGRNKRRKYLAEIARLNEENARLNEENARLNEENAEANRKAHNATQRAIRAENHAFAVFAEKAGIYADAVKSCSAELGRALGKELLPHVSKLMSPERAGEWPLQMRYAACERRPTEFGVVEVSITPMRRITAWRTVPLFEFGETDNV